MAGTATGTAESSGLPDRLAYLSADPIPYAEASLTATRYAYMTPETAQGVAQALITPVRTAWFAAPAMEAEAIQTATQVKERLFTATSEASATSVAEGVRISLMFNKGIPGRAQSYIQEGGISRFRVHQVWREAVGIARAQVRILPNTALGQGTAAAYSESQSIPEQVWQTHSVHGQATAEGAAEAVTNRIRILRAGLVGEAEIALAPTITKDGVRASYQFATTQAESDSVGINSILRRDPGLSLSADAETDYALMYLARGMKAYGTGEASTTGTPRFNNWKFLKGQAVVTGSVSLSGVLVTTQMGPASSVSTSATNSMPIITSWMTAEGGSSSEGIVSNQVLTYMTSALDADAHVSGDAKASNGVRVAGVPAEAVAEESIQPLRIVKLSNQLIEGQSLVFNLLYNINLEDTTRPPSKRRYVVPESHRVYTLANTDRRYAV